MTDLEKRGRLLVELHVMLAVVPRVPVTLQRRLQLAHMHKVLEPFLLRRKKGGIKQGWSLPVRAASEWAGIYSIKVVSDGLEFTQNQSGIRWVGMYSKSKWYQMGWNLLNQKVVSDGLEFTQNQSGIRWVGMYSKSKWYQMGWNLLRRQSISGLEFIQSKVLSERV